VEACHHIFKFWKKENRNAIPVEIASLEVAGDHVVAGGQTEGGTSSTVHNHHPSEHQSRRKRGIFWIFSFYV
jgi:hypothetical protein